MDLLFERFLSEERGEWPDIDLDLPSGDRREQVIQHVYEKYGRLGAAMTANVITYRGRSAAREVGKALGFDPAQVDRLAKVMNNFEFIDPGDSLPQQMAAVGLDLNASRVGLFARLWREMQDLPRHLGQHSGGMVICQGQLDACVPARKRQHARPRRRAVGQGRLRRHGHREGGSARPRDDGGAAGLAGAGQRTTRRIASRQSRSRAPSSANPVPSSAAPRP